MPIARRQFDRFSQVLKEIIDARVWGGIHFRTADVQGAVIGKNVATGSASTTSSLVAQSRPPGRPPDAAPAPPRVVRLTIRP